MGEYSSQKVRGIEQPILGGSWQFTTDGSVQLDDMPKPLRDKIDELMEVLALIPDADTATIKFSNLAAQRDYQRDD